MKNRYADVIFFPYMSTILQLTLNFLMDEKIDSFILSIDAAKVVI